ncbi:O-acyltransferase like protein [Drosophila ficusphila]|uniref:O-acyltransferase like protein n=1 Tax=Drosophila ficusphila TaxID=30025 RepID=UPI0007E749F8|nr:O-acyltransferase like protein [Drosophila ficusphila]
MLILLLLAQVLAVFADDGGCESRSLLKDLVRMVPRHQNATLSACEEQLVELGSAWESRQSWALKALDASGEGFSNFMMGQNSWLGSRFTCGAVHQPVLQDMTAGSRHLLRDVSPFAFDYVVAYIESNSPWQLQVSFRRRPLLHVGLCLPRSCDVPEVERLVRRSLAAGSTFRSWEMDAQLAYAKKPQLEPHFFQSGAVRLFALVAGGTLLLTAAASIGLGRHSRILACFDVTSNWQLAWQPASPGQENRVINGLRVITAFALIGFHVVWYKYASVDPSGEMLSKAGSMFIRHSYWPSMVEIFFVVSGYLTVQNFLKDEQRQQEIAGDGVHGNGRRLLGQFVHRYCRLAPLQFVVILGGVVLVEYQRQVSVRQIADPQDELCRRHGLWNVLFMQNLFPLPEMCGSWTWSLACDMQLHMLATLLLFAQTKHPRAVRWTTYLLLVGGTLGAVLVMQLRGTDYRFDELYATNQWTYTSPLVRMKAYLVGGAFAHSQVRGLASPVEQLLPSPWDKLASALAIGWVLRQMTGDRLPPIGPMYVVMRLLVTTLAGHLIVCGSRSDHGDCCAPTRWLLDVLQSEALQRISRFTYAIYLLNPIVIIHFYHTFSSEVLPDNTITLLFTISYSAICYVMAIVMTLLFEIPFNKLTKLLITPRTAKKSS